MTDTSLERRGAVTRTTAETDIQMTFTLDGSGRAQVATGVGFLDHMLTLFTVHGFFDLQVQASGDIHVDDHHSVEDVGISLGQAFAQAVGGRQGIRRYGMSLVPMDETLARVVVDVSNRPFLHFQVELPDQKVGTFDTCLVKEFMRAFSHHAGLTLHIDLLHGDNAHHIIEAIFKALGRALNEATEKKEGLRGALSSKGCL
ncbi:imidazoleglycerol-phosphate dehydratase HisB [Desulfofustis limnaeus]|uniref:Imidazoleglycerol-phosphate dehydratase n=1 Tax=Desulfofustis limnaeus TaxID=2740163 RepID=A0ABN6M6N1_9BACT|nr:imidazoleglycerol-phosphate dehydratase HisB [Desulfofustis limnaeus]BDD86772.1 imidazoleglycerol-phosphate dehydratase [Desulfofustis limnaeus]